MQSPPRRAWRRRAARGDGGVDRLDRDSARPVEPERAEPLDDEADVLPGDVDVDHVADGIECSAWHMDDVRDRLELAKEPEHLRDERRRNDQAEVGHATTLRGP